VSSIDSAVIEHALLAAAWLLWCGLHSVLIARWWMRRMRSLLGSNIAFYRLFYVVISVVTLIPVLWMQWNIVTPLYWSWSFPWSLLQGTALLMSAAMFYLGAREYDHRFFLGIRQIEDHLAERTSEFSGFSSSGILRHVRHPYYTAGILLLLFWGDITAANLIFKIAGIGYFVLGAWLEEKKLLQEFGTSYADYQKRVPMLCPRLSAAKRKEGNP
jgi:protein-S-isoprenylcysteine O-methyltransferase Ste14